jgi:hypothetical protein
MAKEVEKLFFLTVGVLFLAAVLLGAGDDLSNEVTGAAVKEGADKCVKPRQAIKLINEQSCTRIYEDQKCMEQGKVHVQC